MVNQLAKATSELLEILSPLTSEERGRVLNAALALLGEVLPTAQASTGKSRNSDGAGDEDVQEFSSAGRAWMKKNSVTVEQLEQYFHFDQGRVQVIALMGNSKKKSDQTESAYLALGLAAFLATGDSSFSDEDARSLCQHFGCYDGPNHARNIKGLGNRLTGSKAAGWKLTAPGLSGAADLVRSAPN